MDGAVKVLVLGASGFVGGAIARRLITRGDHVSVLLRDPAQQTVPGAHVERGDLGDPHAIARAAEGVDAVVHAAGIVSPRAAPRALRWTLIAGTENVVNACRYVGVRRLVHVGCSDVTLTNGDRVHWDERRHLPHPYGERARALALAEDIALSAATPEFDVIALRPAWVWGPGDTSRLPSLCREALAEGGVQLCGAGQTFLATVYIENLVEAVLRALEAGDASARAYYVADPEVLHAREIFRLWSEAAGLPPPQSGPPRWLAWSLAALRGRGPAGLAPEDVLLRTRSTLFDVSAATGRLGFEPKVKLEDGLHALSAWVKEQGGPKALAERERPPPDARSVDAQVAAAGGD
jgi:nucleoside-diphosphate-sugar epimerase